MPDDWLEEEEALIPDPEAKKPSDWDDSMDGEWEAPKVDNPKCKGRSGCGKWTKPMVDNPNYKVSFEFRTGFSLYRTVISFSFVEKLCSFWIQFLGLYILISQIN